MPINTPTRTLSYADALNEACFQEMERDDTVFVFGLDVDDHKAIQNTTKGLVERFGASRCFSTPLSEDAMTGVGIGAAMAGMRPIHVHIRMDFLMLCMNQLVNIAAKSYYMYNGQLKVPLVVRTLVGRSWGQGAQHSQALHSMIMHVPGLKIIAPSNAYDAKGGLIAAIRDNNPVICMEHRLLYSTQSYVPETNFALEIGKGRIVKEGKDITIVAISHMVLESIRASRYLDNVGVSAEIIDPISLKPLDIDIIEQSVLKTKSLLVVDNGWLTCGASAEIITQLIERLQKRSVGLNTIALERLGFAETTCPTTRSLEDLFYPNSKTIADKAFNIVSKQNINWSLMRNELATEIEQFKGPF